MCVWQSESQITFEQSVMHAMRSLFDLAWYNCRLDDAHIDAIVAEVLQRLDRPVFEAPKYAVDLDSRAQVQYSISSMHAHHACSKRQFLVPACGAGEYVNMLCTRATQL